MTHTNTQAEPHAHAHTEQCLTLDDVRPSVIMVTSHLTEGEHGAKGPRHKQRLGPGETRAAPASESGAIL